MQTNFYSGPDFCKDPDSLEYEQRDNLSFVVPHPLTDNAENLNMLESDVRKLSCHTASGEVVKLKSLITMDRFSSFYKLLSVCRKVIYYIQKLKEKLKERDPIKFAHFELKKTNVSAQAAKLIIYQDQQSCFPEIFEYFNLRNKRRLDMPNIVGQLNIFVDQDGLLRVRSKCEKLKGRRDFPLLLAKDSSLTNLIISDLHRILNHAGVYSVLAEMRKRFYVPCYFSVVKKILRGCIVCRRFKERPIKLNQSPYREWRICPPNVPYRYVFIDFIGPLKIKQGDSQIKVYLFCITCMWSRAVNLVICMDLSVKEFLRAFQMHSFQFGIPEYCISDLGSQIVSGANIIQDYLKDHETVSYFERNGVQSLKFDQFAKGHSELGSMVEVCVKLTKRLLYGAIGKNIIQYRDFEFLIAHTVHLINRRPVAFKEALRDTVGDHIPDPITPENLIHGYDLVSVNIIPELHIDSEPDWHPGDHSGTKLREDYSKLQKIRSNLVKLYQEEFIATLVNQAVDVSDRYKPITHRSISEGDVVLLKENFTKPHDYPMGIVKKVEINDLGEVTGATILKGKSRELVKRHSSGIIPLLTINNEASNHTNSQDKVTQSLDERPKRKAAVVSCELTKKMLKP